MRASLFVQTLIAAFSLLQPAAFAWAQAPVPPSAVALFDDAQLQTITLTINPRDWADLKASYQLNTYYPAHFTWRDQVVRNVAIRSRGTGSRSATKPGLRIDFNLFDERQQFLGLKSLVLRNNVQDPSQMHERLGMALFTRLGMPAPREAHARLFVNGEYAGLYSIVEAVDKVFVERHYGQSNGYLYEYDYDADDAPYRFENRGPAPAAYSPKPFRPVTHELDPDPAPLAAMVRAIHETSTADFERVVSQYLDLETFVAHVAVEAFLAEVDGMLGDWGMNNYYLYRFEGTTRATVIPWDKSEAFKGGVAASIWRNVDDVPAAQRNALMTRAMQVPALRARFLDTLLRCADEALAVAPGEDGGWLEREIRRAYVQIREAALDDPVAPFAPDDFEADVARLVAFARERSAIVREDVRRSPR
jgi:spore coat protein H